MLCGSPARSTYFLALDETRAHLEQLGIPAEKIAVSGISVDPVFAESKDRRAMRVKHGLDPDRTTLLISAGGFGVGPIERLALALLELRHRVQAVAICGRSAELDDLAGDLPRFTPWR